jgi:hypothetical protein
VIWITFVALLGGQAAQPPVAQPPVPQPPALPDIQPRLCKAVGQDLTASSNALRASLSGKELAADGPVARQVKRDAFLGAMLAERYRNMSTSLIDTSRSAELSEEMKVAYAHACTGSGS